MTDRIEHELSVIEPMGFSAYFLIVADLCDYARSSGIRIGPGRGSAAGCAVSYSLGITDLDPLEHGLLFERFLQPERVSMPDIDIDFDEQRRSEMIRYARDAYGEDRVAQIVTFSTIKAKAAIRDSARVLGYPFSFGDKLSKMMPPAVMGREPSLDEAYSQSAELAQAWDQESDAKRVLDTARSLEGLRRQHSIHAAGVVIGAEPLTEHTPLLRVETDGEVVTQYDGGMVEDIGLLKMDFLGLRNLTVITDCLRHVETGRGVTLDPSTFPRDDTATFAMLSSGDTDGVFQLESAGYKALCQKLKPDRFADIIALGALYRPGPMSAGLHTEYARRKHGQSAVEYPHPDLSDILADSYGLLIYQEQVQQIAQRIAGFSLGAADQIRKAIGKKLTDKMAALKSQFIDGCEGAGYGRELGEQLWELIEGFADYAFNKSHAAAYGLVTYQTAYLKAHYPVEYFSALLSSVKNHKERLPAGLHSCRKMGLSVLPPDVNESEHNFAPASRREDGTPTAIRFGLSGIRNVGEGDTEAIRDARYRRGAFTDFSDFCDKVPGSVLNRKTLESLIKAGAFGSLGASRKGLLAVFEPVADAAMAKKRAEAEGQFSLFGGGESAPATLEAPEIPADEFDRSERLAAEREMLGLYVSEHPLDGLEATIAGLSDVAASKAGSERRSGRFTTAGILTGVTKKFTKKGDPYLTGVVEDLEGGLDAVFFPSVAAGAWDVIRDDAIVAVSGRLDDGDPPKLIAGEVREPDLSAETSQPVVLAPEPEQCTDELLDDLASILSDHRGDCEVRVRLATDGEAPCELTLGDSWTVARTGDLFAELKRLVGPQAVEG